MRHTQPQPQPRPQIASTSHAHKTRQARPAPATAYEAPRDQNEDGWFETARKQRRAKEEAQAREENLRVHKYQKQFAYRTSSLRGAYSSFRTAASGCTTAGVRFLVESFIANYRKTTPVAFASDEAAIDEFRKGELAASKDISSPAKLAERAASIINVGGLLALGPVRSLLQGARVFWQRVPSASMRLLDRMGQICARAIATSTTDAVLGNHASVTIHRDEETNRTYIQVNYGGDDGFCFLELPRALPTAPPPGRLLAGLRGALRSLIGSRRPIVWLNGDYEDVNLKQVLPDGPQFRVRDAASATASSDIATLMAAEPISPKNTRVLIGVPGTASEVDAVFHPPEREADKLNRLWSDEASRWDRMRRRIPGGIPTSTASRDALLDALRNSKNVIFIVAHSDGESIFFPDPKPQGSIVTKEDFIDQREAIQLNRPVVYLMCCESATVAETKSLAVVLLEAGARAVYAPQRPIGSPLKLLRHFLKAGLRSSPAVAFAFAEKRTRFTEMEAWIK